MDAIIAAANQTGMLVMLNDRGEYVLVAAQTVEPVDKYPPRRKTISQPPMRTRTESSVCATASDSGVSEHSTIASSTTSFLEAGKAMRYVVQRRVQVRAGISPNTEKMCVLEPGQQVFVVETQKNKNKEPIHHHQSFGPAQKWNPRLGFSESPCEENYRRFHFPWQIVCLPANNSQIT